MTTSVITWMKQTHSPKDTDGPTSHKETDNRPTSRKEMEFAINDLKKKSTRPRWLHW